MPRPVNYNELLDRPFVGGKVTTIVGTVRVDPSGDGENQNVLIQDVAPEHRDGLYYVRQGNGVCGWVNEKIPGAVLIVLSDATLVYNLPSGYAIFITQYCYAVETSGDDCQFEFGWCDAVDGGGAFTALGPHKHLFTGAANLYRTAFDQDILPASRLAYSDGVRSITFRVLANDANCEITVGWHGWIEPEI